MQNHEKRPNAAIVALATSLLSGCILLYDEVSPNDGGNGGEVAQGGQGTGANLPNGGNGNGGGGGGEEGGGGNGEGGGQTCEPPPLGSAYMESPLPLPTGSVAVSTDGMGLVVLRPMDNTAEVRSFALDSLEVDEGRTVVSGNGFGVGLVGTGDGRAFYSPQGAGPVVCDFSMVSTSCGTIGAPSPWNGLVTDATGSYVLGIAYEDAGVTLFEDNNQYSFQLISKPGWTPAGERGHSVDFAGEFMTKTSKTNDWKLALTSQTDDGTAGTIFRTDTNGADQSRTGFPRASDVAIAANGTVYFRANGTNGGPLQHLYVWPANGEPVAIDGVIGPGLLELDRSRDLLYAVSSDEVSQFVVRCKCNSCVQLPTVCPTVEPAKYGITGLALDRASGAIVYACHASKSSWLTSIPLDP